MDMKLSEKLEAFRTDLPSEWMMDEFIRDAEILEKRVDSLQKLANIIQNLNEKSGELGEGMCLRMKELAEEIVK